MAQAARRRGVHVPTDAPDTPLAQRLRARIAADGPLPFHDFMAAALYDPEHGYYARGPAIGPEGDFSTSVSFPAFRQAFGRFVLRTHELLGAPERYRVVELGAGTGQLAAAVVDAWRKAQPHAELDYVTVDASPGLRARQASLDGVRSVASPRDLEPAEGLVFGNEVLDALPIRRVVGGADELLEVHVDVDPATGRFVDRLRPLTDPGTAAQLARVGARPQRGQILDVAPAMPGFVRDAARLVARGWLVFVDYGDPAHVLYAPDRLNGTLAAYRAQGQHHDPYAHVGEQDLTADVDFTTVTLAAEDERLLPLGLATQQEWLEALDIGELGMPDEVRLVAGAAGLGTAFHVAAFRTHDAPAALPGFA